MKSLSWNLNWCMFTTSYRCSKRSSMDGWIYYTWVTYLGQCILLLPTIILSCWPLYLHLRSHWLVNNGARNDHFINHKSKTIYFHFFQQWLISCLNGHFQIFLTTPSWIFYHFQLLLGCHRHSLVHHILHTYLPKHC